MRETLAETADIARSEEEYWQKEVERVLPEVWQAEQRTLEPAALAALPLALRRRVVQGGSGVAGIAAGVPSRGRDSWTGRRSRRSAMLPEGWVVSIDDRAGCNSIAPAGCGREFGL